MGTKMLSVFTSMISLALLGACAEKPAPELNAAQQALETAENAEAPIYAQEQYAAAEEALKGAEAEIAVQDESFFLGRNYDKAKELLNKAKSEAQAAASTAAANKEEAGKQAEAALAEAQQAIQAATQALQKAPRGKGTRADIEALKADLEAAQTSLGEAQQAFENGKYADALSQVKAVKEKVDLVNSEIQQAVQRRRGR